jgi:hypothetical protein
MNINLVRVICKRDFRFGKILFKKGNIYFGYNYRTDNNIYIYYDIMNGMWFSSVGGCIDFAEFSKYFMDVTLYERKEKLKKIKKLGM